MTTLTTLVHCDQWQTVLPVVLPQLLDQGWRPEDFARVKSRQINMLVQDLRSNNEEELGKERLQTNIFRSTPYGHVSLGTVAGLNAITLDDVKGFAGQMYTRANLTIGVSGDAPEELIHELRSHLGTLLEGPAAPRITIDTPRRSGISVEILEKDTRATAILYLLKCPYSLRQLMLRSTLDTLLDDDDGALARIPNSRRTGARSSATIIAFGISSNAPGM